MQKWKNLCQNKKPKIGIAIYPSKVNVEKIIDYCKLAQKYNIKRIFTNLIGLTKNEIKNFVSICKKIKSLEFKIIVDIDETVLEILNIKLSEINKWEDLNVQGIRLDTKFSPQEIASLSNNKKEFQIEINASDFLGVENEIVKFSHSKDNIVASHNFFPQKFTGLSIEKFCTSSLKMTNKGFKVSAFASKRESHHTISAWNESENSSTLEIGRNMNVVDEIRYLMKFDFLDYIIVSNMYLTEEEFQRINQLNNKELNLSAELNKDITKEEQNIVEFRNHRIRGDNPDDVFLRSTISRKIFKNKILSRERDDFLYPGQIVICNSRLGRYANELHVLKKRIPNIDYKKNVVGKIGKNQIPLLEISCPNLIINFKIHK